MEFALHNRRGGLSRVIGNVAMVFLFVPSLASIWAADEATAGKPVPEGEMKSRQAVIKAAAFLDGDGAKLEKNASCINCHHAPLRAWALREASQGGVQVDLTSLQTTTASQLKRLADLKEDYRDKQWGHSLSAFYLLGSPDDPSASLSQDDLQKLVDIVVAEQSADGSWKAAQQFGNQRRPKRDGNQAQTLWNLLALSRMEKNAAAASATERGLKWLRAAEPGTTIDVRAVRLVVELRWGHAEHRQEFLKPLLESQNPDGGWGWQPNDASEAWATGLALFALSQANDASLKDVLSRGRDFLVKTQKDNGSWLVEGKLTKNSDMSSYFGTAWGMIGLSRTRSLN